MKELNKMSEQDILQLTDEEVEKIIKLRLAQEGIPFVQKPIEPEYFPIPEKDLTVYYIPLFGDDYLYTEYSEANALLEVLTKIKSMGSYEWNSNISSDYIYFKPGKRRRYYSSQSDDLTIQSKTIYSAELYNSVYEYINQNNILKTEYKRLLDEYNNSVDSVTEIKDEVWNIVNDIRNKYYRMDSFLTKFKCDYLPLAENDIDIAMKFIVKAYGLGEETQNYIIENLEKQND